MAVLAQTLEKALDHYSSKVAEAFDTDVFSFLGGIRPDSLSQFRLEMEDLAESARNNDEPKPDNLAFLIYTPGGLAEVVENMVNISRHHYKEIWFVVPDMAMSAGTILCMAGDKIYMDYSSALGPIDPQVQNSEGQFVPALGYLDQVERMLEKSANNDLTDAEFAMLQNMDLATLRRYEQARDLSISLLKEWLVKYKFKDWHTHSSTGNPVSEGEKEQRAMEIAKTLSDHKRWHSHGRMIGINTLQDELNLKIEDYTNDLVKKAPIRQYSDLLLEYASNQGLNSLIHTRALNPEL